VDFVLEYAVAELDKSARTMRIDIHPDFLGESLERKKQSSHRDERADAALSSARSSRESHTEDDKYEKLLSSVYDAVLITDQNGAIVDFNGRSMDFFFCDESDLSGEDVITLISGASESLLASIRTNLKDHRYTLIEAYCVRRDKSLFPAEIAVNKVDLDGERRLCFFVRDVSVRKQAQEALEHAIARLEAHDRARSQFVSNVSHELKTPLTSMIYAVANMLKGVVGPLSEPVRTYLEMLDGNCRRLLSTVDDILDLRKIETNTLTLVKSKTPFSRMVKRSVESLRVQAEQKPVALKVTVEDRSLFVDCDAQKMERVVLNVVGNAIKFTSSEGVVNVSVKRSKNLEKHVVLSVEDNGIGIPLEAVGKVTDRYFTVGEQPSGSGLGLAISKEIVELHGGRLEIESPYRRESRGTGVYVSLPVVDPPAVLVVDDDKRVVDVLDRQLSAQGYRVNKAGTGADALESVAKERPDVIILDLVLPGMDGSEVILRLKSDKSLRKIPLIAITGAGIGTAKAHVLNSFSVQVLSKPWQEAELLDAVEGVFLGAATLTSGRT
jgi:PAS domain S-box-containing protein